MVSGVRYSKTMLLHQCTTINIKGESYRLKNRKKLGLQTKL